MADYGTFFGVVQFDPEVREANNQKVIRLPVRVGTRRLSVSVWPELADAAEGIEKGDVIVFEGKVDTRVVNGKEYHNLSATGIAKLTALTQSAPPAAGAKTGANRRTRVEDEDWA